MSESRGHCRRLESENGWHSLGVVMEYGFTRRGKGRFALGLEFFDSWLVLLS